MTPYALTDFDRNKAAMARQLNQIRNRLDDQFARARIDVAIAVMRMAQAYWMDKHK